MTYNVVAVTCCVEDDNPNEVEELVVAFVLGEFRASTGDGCCSLWLLSRDSSLPVSIPWPLVLTFNGGKLFPWIEGSSVGLIISKECLLETKRYTQM